MLKNAYFLAKIGADTAENEQHFAEILPIGRGVAGRRGAGRRRPRPEIRSPAANGCQRLKENSQKTRNAWPKKERPKIAKKFAKGCQLLPMCVNVYNSYEFLQRACDGEPLPATLLPDRRPAPWVARRMRARFHYVLYENW